VQFSTVGGDGATTVVAEVTLDKAFAGPPGAVHGGVLAGLFDEVVGAAAGAAAPGRVAVTGKLTVRYRTPTPLRTPLRIEATVTRRSSRLLPVTATCTAEGATTATAEALMVLR
jgi:acyl-coenzyme A thioesterase PaaI-like protein